MEDVKLQKFFNINRWEEMIEKGFNKGLDMGLLRQLCAPENRIQLLHAIVDEKYEIAPPHIARIPKDNGDYREVYVNEPIDRIFLSIYNDILFEMFGDKIHPACRSYQKGIGCPHVVKNISDKISHMNKPLVGYKVDLSKYFDSVKIEVIDQALMELNTGSPLDVIVEHYYHNDLVFDVDGNLVEHYGSLKQGCAVASFLADYVLRDIDAKISSMADIYVRYSDDILIIGENASAALLKLKEMLAEKGLGLNPKKVEPLSKDKFFTFLGFNICGDKITFSKKSIKNFQNEIENRTIKSKYKTDICIKKVIQYMYEGYIIDGNQFGWAAYFLSTVNVDEDVQELNKFVMDCIRAVDSKKYKIGGLGENKQLIGKVVSRGTGKNVTSNKIKWRQKYGNDKIDGYLTIMEMKNALHFNRALYITLVNQVLM